MKPRWSRRQTASRASADTYDALWAYWKAFERAPELIVLSAYNNATGSLDSRLLVSARKLHELRASGVEVVSVPKAIEADVRLPAGGVANDGELLGAAE